MSQRPNPDRQGCSTATTAIATVTAIATATVTAPRAVFGIPDKRWGEVPAAHVVLSPDASISEDELIDFCTTKIARFKRPRIVRFVSSLPKTAVGKIRKNELRAPYWQGYDRNI